MPQLNFNALTPAGPQNVYEGFMQGQQARNQLAQQVQARQLADIQLQNAMREQRMAGEEEASWKAGAGNPQAVLQQLQQRGLGKQAMALQGQLTKQQTDKLTQQKTTVELVKNAANQVFANPTNAAQILQSFSQRTGIDVSDDLAQIQQLGGNTEAVKQWAAGHALEADKLLPKFQHLDTGSALQLGTTDYTGKFTPTQTLGKTMTPGEAANLKVAQGQLQVARDRLAKDGAALDPAENAAISKAIIEGRLDPNRVNGRNAKILATTLLANPSANVLELGVSAAGATASERALATQTAKMSTAANEANKMVDVVRGLSDKVDRTEFPSVNAISNAVAKGTGGAEIVQLNTSINALVNSYARAISPTGQPTVSDKNHAREIINSAYSQGQLGAILDVMQQEMSIARQAAGTSSTELRASRETARGRPSVAAPSAAGGLSPAEQAELQQLRARFGK